MTHHYTAIAGAIIKRPAAKALEAAINYKTFFIIMLGIFLLGSREGKAQQDIPPYATDFSQSSNFNTLLRSGSSISVANGQLNIVGGTGQNAGYEGYAVINTRKFDIKLGYTYTITFDAVAYDNAQASAGIVEFYHNGIGIASSNTYTGTKLGTSITVAKGVATSLVTYRMQFIATANALDHYIALKLTDAQGGNNSALTIDNLRITGSCAPSVPQALGSGSCTPTRISLQASGATGGETYQWYYADKTAIPGATSASYLTDHLTTTTIFYVAKISSLNCASEKVAVIARIGDPIPPTVTSNARCQNGQQTITFTASGAGVNEVYRWYTAAGVFISEGPELIRTTNLQSGNYYVEITGSGSCKARTDINVPNNKPNPDAPDPITLSQCGDGAVKIDPVVESGMSLRWFSSSGDFLGEGTSYITPEFVAGTATTTYTYFISKVNIATRCESTRAQVTVTINPIIQASSIIGSNAVCQGVSNVTYEVPSIGSATYNWSITSSGSTAMPSFTGQNTNRITVSYPNASFVGEILVTVSNTCSFYTSSIAVQATNSNVATGRIIEPANLELGKRAEFKFETNVPDGEIAALQWYQRVAPSNTWSPVQSINDRDIVFEQMPGNINGLRVDIQVRSSTASTFCITSLGSTETYTSNSFSIGNTTIVPLPVELISFKAQRHAQGVNLTWATASELDNKGFEVQVSTNSKDFTAIGFVESKVGTTFIRQDYSFLDTKAVSGTRYYRLKQIDFDGKSEYSAIRAVALDGGNGAVTAYPNPFDDVVVVRLNGTEARSVRLVLLNAQGKAIMEQQQETAGNTVTVDMSSVSAKGMYILHVLDNGNKHAFKLMKR